MISIDIDRIIFSYAPNDVKLLNRYYFNFSYGLKLQNIKYNQLFYITLLLSDQSLERIRYINLFGYRSMDSFVDNVALKRVNPFILYMDNTIFTSIEHMSNLIELSLVNNFYINNFTLSKLINLKTLNITNTNISDLGIINLKNLEEITFGIDYTTLDRELEEYKIFISLTCLKQLKKLKYIKIFYGYDTEEYNDINLIKDI